MTGPLQPLTQPRQLRDAAGWVAHTGLPLLEVGGESLTVSGNRIDVDPGDLELREGPGVGAAHRGPEIDV